MGAWKYIVGPAVLAGILVTPALIIVGLGGGSFDDALFDPAQWTARFGAPSTTGP